MSELEILIRRLIAEHGPISLARYMALALAHPTLGYYVTRDPLGARGDFLTAPEASQMFGELIGLALGQAWLDRGSPKPADLVELGPGRGTLMADAWHALARVPGARQALAIRFVETSPVLQQAQRLRLADAPVDWFATVAELPEGRPLFLVANEFLDALPVHQFVRRADGWHERHVGVDDAAALVLVDHPAPLGRTIDLAAPVGSITEVSPAREAIVAEIARRIVAHGGVALLIDYGAIANGPTGDTLQAVRAHRRADPLTAPGEADLTTQVEFGALLAAARHAGAIAHGPVTQGVFLDRLGIGLRLERLLDVATDEQRQTLENGYQRLTDPRQMGTLFKVVALTAPGDPVPPGFTAAEGLLP